MSRGMKAIQFHRLNLSKQSAALAAQAHEAMAN
jgi:hypothetical protein